MVDVKGEFIGTRLSRALRDDVLFLVGVVPDDLRDRKWDCESDFVRSAIISFIREHKKYLPVERRKVHG